MSAQKAKKLIKESDSFEDALDDIFEKNFDSLQRKVQTVKREVEEVKGLPGVSRLESLTEAIDALHQPVPRAAPIPDEN